MLTQILFFMLTYFFGLYTYTWRTQISLTWPDPFMYSAFIISIMPIHTTLTLINSKICLRMGLDNLAPIEASFLMTCIYT